MDGRSHPAWYWQGATLMVDLILVDDLVFLCKGLVPMIPRLTMIYESSDELPMVRRR